MENVLYNFTFPLRMHLFLFPYFLQLYSLGNYSNIQRGIVSLSEVRWKGETLLTLKKWHLLYKKVTDNENAHTFLKFLIFTLNTMINKRYIIPSIKISPKEKSIALTSGDRADKCIVLSGKYRSKFVF